MMNRPPAPERTSAVLTVDLAAVAANTRTFAQRVTGDLMAVVKADGFGHGADDIARTALASGAGRLGVTGVAEALALRSAGLQAPVLSWLNPVAANFSAALVGDVELAVASVQHLAAVSRAAVETGIVARIHLHVDVGMARDGAPPALWGALCEQARLAEHRRLVNVVGIMAHLGCAEDPRDQLNAHGRRRFDCAVRLARARGLRPTLRHLAGTAATLADESNHFDMCRIGAGLVGIDPAGTAARGLLQPAVTLTAPVVNVREVPAGTWVGYGRSYRTPNRTRLALLPVGYADGIPRSISAQASVWLSGRRRRLVGLVSMDQVVVDVADDGVQPGDVAMVFGPGGAGEPTVAEWAAWAGTIEHDIVTGIGTRVQRQTQFIGSLELCG